MIDAAKLVSELMKESPEIAAIIDEAEAAGRAVHVVWKSCDKVRYGHEATALKAADAMHKKTGDSYDAYYCDECNAWHIGHAQS